MAGPLPGTAAYAQHGDGNTANDNGIAGISIHSHAPLQDMNGNVITGNHAEPRRAHGQRRQRPGDSDAGDTHTTGILVLSAAAPITGTVVTGNTISDVFYGVWMSRRTHDGERLGQHHHRRRGRRADPRAAPRRHADRRHGAHAVGPRLLASRSADGAVLPVRRRRLLRLARRLRRSRRRSSASRRRPRATATGSSRPTAASSRSATPTSTARRARSTSTSPIVGMAATDRRATATGSSRPTAASSRSAARSSTAPPARSISTSRRRHGRGTVGPRATGSSRPTAASSVRQRHVPRLDGRGAPQPAGRRHGRRTDGARLLARRGRRRHLQLRHRDVPRLHRAPSVSTQPIVGMTATPTGLGYWLVASRRRHLLLRRRALLRRREARQPRPAVGARALSRPARSDHRRPAARRR